ncbi:murein L,D-transpeptidase family protein [Mesorhizobium sp. VK24D]|uniref:Murein L,D-transpeptidase family protein n=1 Tax=Mesorhizobium album TaxID=3072314 RepID=A0ABU4XT75_9HYPH|nr:murein L,D-transpeptidase family protein [Mesorhizobium sp. VK24D]MDX8477913.1 murein L,D-transpeptidase family protein [Mesorhizobium sp. VK24D]
MSKRISVWALALTATLAGCVSTVSTVLEVENKAVQPMSSKLLAEMAKKGMTAQDPILVRIFKDESELEVWKRDRSGKYALLKTFPMCRWSGKLGPKTKTGDRQAPEGFYNVSAGMLNPNSQYYLSFNLGYPNRLEKALGYTGEAIMVHGACSSSGCFALTDEGVAEIYTIAREALKGGQTAFQVQSLPFHMTPENMARNRSNPNFEFWTNIKQGYDYFEVTKREPKVSACGRHYAFNTEFDGGEPSDPLAPCPPSSSAGTGDPKVAAKQAADTRAMEAALQGKPEISEHAYLDGGMHPSFRALLKRRGAQELAKETSLTDVPISRPESALADPHKPGE